MIRYLIQKRYIIAVLLNLVRFSLFLNGDNFLECGRANTSHRVHRKVTVNSSDSSCFKTGLEDLTGPKYRLFKSILICASLQALEVFKTMRIILPEVGIYRYTVYIEMCCL